MRKLFILVFASAFLAIGYGAVGAQSDQNTITVEPASLNIELAPNDAASSTVTITNHYATEVRLTAEFRGIESGTGRIIPGGTLDQQLANSLRLSETEFTIPPNSKHFLTVFIADNVDLPAGGHYATLVLSDNTNSSGESSIRPQVSIGLFLVKKQGEILKIELIGHEFRSGLFQFPTLASVEFINDGNVHIIPRGYVRIFDDDYVYYETVLNTQSKLILPTQRYIEDLQLDIRSTALLPKRVTAEIGHRADGVDDIQTYSEEFWYIPRWYGIALIIPVAGIVIYVRVSSKRKSKN